MYIGHLGIALGAHAVRRTIPLWLLLIAAQIPDWLDAGVCAASGNRGPDALYTHGLYVVGGFALLLLLVYSWSMRDTIGGILLALVTASHYALDYITGLKPTWPGGPAIGLQLYANPGIELASEGVVILVGWWMYRRSVPPKWRNHWTVYAILVTLLLFQAAAGIAFRYHLAGEIKC